MTRRNLRLTRRSALPTPSTYSNRNGVPLGQPRQRKYFPLLGALMPQNSHVDPDVRGRKNAAMKSCRQSRPTSVANEGGPIPKRIPTCAFPRQAAPNAGSTASAASKSVSAHTSCPISRWSRPRWAKTSATCGLMAGRCSPRAQEFFPPLRTAGNPTGKRQAAAAHQHDKAGF